MEDHAKDDKPSLEDFLDDSSKMTLKHVQNLGKQLEELQQYNFNEIFATLAPVCHNFEDLVRCLTVAELHKAEGSFSSITKDDIRNMGVVEKYLNFNDKVITEAQSKFSPSAKAEIEGLASRLIKLYARVNPDSQGGCYMMTDAILFSLTEIANLEKRNVIIIPKIRIPLGEGHEIARNPASGFQMRLSGTVDYAVIECDDAHKGHFIVPRIGWMHPFDHATGCFLLGVANPWSGPVIEHVPAAIGQAIAFLKHTRAPEVRLCITNGKWWLFLIVKLQGQTFTSYESSQYSMSPTRLENSDRELSSILLLLSEWLHPTIEGLFALQDHLGGPLQSPVTV